MTRRVRLGMLTPSSNTVLEPVTARMLNDAPHITAHFSRFRVTEISLSDYGLQQFDPANMVPAALLLADGKVDAIAWNGTSASWLGIERDTVLCEAITQACGVPATTSTLAFHRLFRTLGVTRIGLVTPYTHDVQARIVTAWGKAGFDCSIERHLGWHDNFSFASADAPTIETMIRDVAARDCEAVAILCTNMDGARLAAALEPEIGIPVIDSVAVTLWDSLALARADLTGLASWGSLFHSKR